MSNNTVVNESAGVIDAQADLALLGLRLRDTLDTIREAVFQLDRDRRCQFLNAAWSELTGQCISETLDRPIEQFFLQEDGAEVVRMIQESLEGDHSEPAELRLLKRDGSWIWVELRTRVVRDDQGNAIGVSGTLLDIHTRRRVQAQLRESENLFRTAFDLSPNGIAILNSDARFTQCNRAMCELFAQPIESLLATDFYSLIQAEELSHAKKAIRRAQAGKTTRGIELKGRTQDGRSIWIELAASLLSTESGAAPVVLIQVQDLSERKRIETDLQSQNQILYHAKGMLEAQKCDLDQQSEQLHLARQLAEESDNAKTELLASVSHQIRTPINQIISYGELLSDSTQDPQARAQCARAIDENSRRVLAIIDDVQDLARIETGRLKLEHSEFELQAMFNEAVSLVGTQAAEREIQLSCSIVGDPSERFHSDGARIRQILFQMTSSAINAKQRGSISIEIDTTQASQVSGFRKLQMTVAENDAQPYSSVAIGTNETPIAPCRGGGSQFGLLLARRLVELLGGTLVVSNSESERRLVVTLNVEPAAVPTQLPKAPQPTATRVAAGSDGVRLIGRVLAVGQTQEDQKLIGLALRRSGLDVVFADGYAQTLTALEKGELSGSAINLILTSVSGQQPGSTQLVNAIRERWPALPIIAIACDGNSEAAEPKAGARFNELLAGPIDPRALLDLLARYLPHAGSDHAHPALIVMQPALVSSLLSNPMAQDRLSRYIESLPMTVTRLEQALEAWDTRLLQAMLCDLKASAANFGFEAISARASAAEASIRLAAARSDVGQFVLEAIRLIQRVQGYGNSQNLAA